MSRALPVLKDANHLDFIRTKWNEFVSRNFDFQDALNLNYYASAIHDIQNFFHKNNLDIHDDANFDFFQPGLTARIYHQKSNQLQALFIINKFSLTLGAGVDRNTGHFTPRRYYVLKNLVETDIPLFHEGMKHYGLPMDTNILHQHQLSLIITLFDNKTLAAELEKAALAAMQDKFLHLVYYSDECSKNAKFDRSAALNALSNINQIREMYEDCKDIYIPSMLKKIYDKNNGEVYFLIDNLGAMEKDLTLALCKDDIKTVKKFQDEGHYILDASGSGHGMMALPFQDMLEKLQKAKIDIHDPQTYEQMGITMDEFRQRYFDERRAAQNSPHQHEQRLLKPKFRI